MELINVKTSSKDLDDRINKAVELITEYGQIDGAHHKMWVIDQVLRALKPDEYDKIVHDACCNSEYGPDTYDWDKGIAP